MGLLVWHGFCVDISEWLLHCFLAVEALLVGCYTAQSHVFKFAAPCFLTFWLGSMLLGSQLWCSEICWFDFDCNENDLGLQAEERCRVCASVKEELSPIHSFHVLL